MRSVKRHIQKTLLNHNMHKAALYTGSFDPFTLGHLDIVHRAAETFHWVIIGVAVNPKKNYLFTIEERIRFIKLATGNWANISVIEIPEGRLVADIAFEQRCVLVKGVRINADFDYERMLHDISYAHQHDLDTYILPSRPHLGHISSTAAKEVCKLNGNTEEFVTMSVKQAMEEKLTKQVRVGITGTIGVGKSTITKALVNRLQENGKKAFDLDIDAIAHDIMFVRKEPIYVQLREDLLSILEIPTWTKYHIGNAIFNQESKRVALNQRLKQPLMTRIRAEIQGKEGFVFVNCALLAEAGMLPFVNNNVVVLDIDETEQTKRLTARGYDADQIKRRVASQYSTVEKLKVIDEAQTKDNHGLRKILRTDARKTVDHCVDQIVENFIPYLCASSGS